VFISVQIVYNNVHEKLIFAETKKRMKKMTTHFVSLHELRVGKYYRLINFRRDVNRQEVERGYVETCKVINVRLAGKLLNIRQYGRPYDPEVELCFDLDGQIYDDRPSFGISERWVEYEVDTEEKSKKRIQERTKFMAIEIQGNDWALRPENVVATQGIDISNFAP